METKMEVDYMLWVFTCFLQKLDLTITPEACYVNRYFMLMVEKFRVVCWKDGTDCSSRNWV